MYFTAEINICLCFINWNHLVTVLCVFLSSVNTTKSSNKGFVCFYKVTLIKNEVEKSVAKWFAEKNRPILSRG